MLFGVRDFDPEEIRYVLRVLTDEELREVREMTRGSAVRYPANKSRYFWVALHKGRIVGTASWDEGRHSIWLKTDFVKQAYRGRGIYRNLFRRRMNSLVHRFRVADRRHSLFEAYVSQEAIGVYESFGFRRVIASDRPDRHGLTYVALDTSELRHDTFKFNII